jgi:hypothetical protein
MALVLKENDKFYLIPNITNSSHSELRRYQRGISKKHVVLAYKYGRVIYAKNAKYYVIGLKEISCYIDIEPELKSINGVQVVIAKNGTILTVYKNINLHKIKACKHK